MKKTLVFLCVAALALAAVFLYRKKEDLQLMVQIYSWAPAWAVEQIQRDVAECTAFNQKDLDETYRQASLSIGFLCRYRIIDNEIYRQGPPYDHYFRVKTFDKMLKRIGRTVRLPEVDFIICMEDGVTYDQWQPLQTAAPLVAWAKQATVNRVLLIPDVLTTNENSWYLELSGIEKKWCEWEQKEPIAFWRGVTNDKGYSESNYTSKPRYLISALSMQRPDLVDAGFNRAYPESIEAMFQKMGLMKSHAAIFDHLRYKYLPVLDGYMCTYPGFQWRLFSGSVPFKQQSDEMQYFYSALQPFVHYVPIANDMSDLIAKVEWAMAHDKECKQIASNARAFAQSSLRPEMIYAYLYRALTAYAKLQSFQLKDLKEETLSDSRWMKR